MALPGFPGNSGNLRGEHRSGHFRVAHLQGHLDAQTGSGKPHLQRHLDSQTGSGKTAFAVVGAFAGPLRPPKRVPS